MVSGPPSGIASRALTQRLRIASSSWLGSASAGGRSGSRRRCTFDGRPDRAGDQIAHAAEQGGRYRPLAVCSVCRRAKPSRRWTSVLARSAACSALRSRRADRASSSAYCLLQQVERAGDRGQQIVEVVRDAAGQLAERLELLRLVELRDRRFVLGGALLDPLLEVGGELVQSSSRARASYCRRRPRSADWARLTRVVGWNGRSRKVTLPSSSR